MKGHLRWCGYLMRIESSRLTKSGFYSELSSGKRHSNGQYLRYKDLLKRIPTAIAVSPKLWEQLAANRMEWRIIVHRLTTAPNCM